MNLVYLPAAVLLVVLVSSPDAPRSDQTGVYGIVEEVVFRPNAKEPKSAEFRGIFAVAVGVIGVPASATAAPTRVAHAGEGKHIVLKARIDFPCLVTIVTFFETGVRVGWGRPATGVSSPRNVCRTGILHNTRWPLERSRTRDRGRTHH